MISEDVNRAMTFAASIKMIIYPQVTAVIHRWLVFYTERYKCFFKYECPTDENSMLH